MTGLVTQGKGRQLALALQWQDSQDFASFVPGSANQLPLDALQQLLQDADGGALYLWGQPGSGKTHLLRAACASLQQQGRQAVYLTPASPPSHWPELDQLAAMGAGTLLAIDDVQRCKDWQQQALFGLFNAARQQRQAFLAAGDSAPAALPLRDDLRTRLAWGLALGLQPLDDSERLQALQALAARRGFALGDELSRYILNHHARDMGSLNRLVEQLDTHALERGRAASIPLLKSMLAQPDPPPTR